MNADDWFEKAEALREKGYLARCLPLYEKAAAAAGPGQEELRVEAALALIASLRTLGRSGRALRVCGRLETFLHKAGLNGYARDLRLERALCLRARGDYRASITALVKLRQDYRREGDLAAVGYIDWALGGAYRFMGSLSTSEGCFRRSLALARRLRDSRAAGYAMAGLGGVTRIRGDLSAAARWYQATLESFKDGSDRFGQAYAHCGYGNVLRQLERSRDAEKHYRQAYTLYAGIGDEVDLGYVRWGQGKVFEKTSRLREAEKAFRDAYRLFLKGDEKRGEVLAQLSLAAVAHARGRTDAAEKLFRTAYEKTLKHGLHAHLESFT